MSLVSVPGATVRAEIDRILAREEFRGRSNPLRDWIAERIEDVLDALGRMFGVGPRVVGDVLVWILYALLAVALVWITWRIARSYAGRRQPAGEAGVELDPVARRRARIREMRRAAAAARARGERVVALRLYFTALVVGLGEKGDLEYRDAWTNREILERGEPGEAVRNRLTPLVRELDARSFGDTPTADADVEAMSRLVDDLLGAEAAA